jgi:hypothetical protein
METRITNTVPVASLATARHEAAPVRDAVRTDLNPPAAISAQVGAEQVRWTRDGRSSEGRRPGEKTYESSIETDRETGDLVYKIIDPETRAVMSQYPYESLLKLRAYIRNVDLKE